MVTKPLKSSIPSGILARPGEAPGRVVTGASITPVEPSVNAAGKGETIKSSTVGTTLYLLPDESWRLKEVAIRLRTSVHELLLDALDSYLATHGEAPIERYSRNKKGKR